MFRTTKVTGSNVYAIHRNSFFFVNAPRFFPFQLDRGKLSALFSTFYSHACVDNCVFFFNQKTQISKSSQNIEIEMSFVSPFHSRTVNQIYNLRLTSSAA
ncbi:unnamed protein product [Hydatigera taeniaeformis]|uniref:Uncharacterized protein n=1 Tax=Hydatigena taeniaeformis TaxID=6205 RepID=A0A3P7EA66_HYDTA|nr:unnamed protein product [Hydatigera taeniaeformis]